MFSIGGNFVIVFLIVYFMINQGIKCPDATQETSTDSTSNGVILSLTKSIEYTKLLKEVNYAIIIYNTSEKNESCETVFGIVKELVALDEYKNIKLYSLDELHKETVTPSFVIAGAPEMIAIYKGKYLGGLDSKNSLNKTLVEKLFKTLLSNDQE